MDNCYELLQSKLNTIGGYSYENLNRLFSNNELTRIYSKDIFPILSKDAWEYYCLLFDPMYDNRIFLRRYLLGESNFAKNFMNCFLFHNYFKGCEANHKNFILFFYDVMNYFYPGYFPYSYGVIEKIMRERADLIFCPNGEITIKSKNRIKDSEYMESLNIIESGFVRLYNTCDRYIFAEHNTYLSEKKLGLDNYWISRFVDGEGYDNLSFDTFHNRDKLIEDKSCVSPTIYLSQNELNVAREAYRLNIDYFINYYKFFFNDYFELDGNKLMNDCGDYYDVEKFDELLSIGAYYITLTKFKFGGDDIFYHESGDIILKYTCSDVSNQYGGKSFEYRREDLGNTKIYKKLIL